MAKRRFTQSLLVWSKRAALGLLGIALLTTAVGAGWEAYERQVARKDYPPVGRLIDIGGRRIHLDCRGQGSPTVVLENGLDIDGTLAWSAVHNPVAAFTRTCAYDRAGIAWSDDKNTLHDADGVVSDLRATLRAAGEKGPFVLVGHSLGGTYAMNYVRKHSSEIAGLVFIDASHPDQIDRIRAAGIHGANEGSTIVLQILARLTWSGLPRLLFMGQSMPNASLTANSEMRAFASVGLPAAAAEAEQVPRTMRQAGALRTLGARPLGERPLVVLTGTKTPAAELLKEAGMTLADYNRLRALVIVLHDDEASWSSRGRHQLVPDATHYIQLERPDVVIAAIKEVVADVRAEKKAQARTVR